MDTEEGVLVFPARELRGGGVGVGMQEHWRRRNICFFLAEIAISFSSFFVPFFFLNVGINGERSCVSSVRYSDFNSI